MTPVGAFAGIVDWRTPPTAHGLDAALTRAGTARTLVANGMALGWVGNDDPVEDDGRLVFVDGDVFEVAGAGEGPVDVAGIAALHRRLGDELFPKLRADAVVLVHDPARRRLVLVRDQLGERSLVWYRTGSRVLFASEVVHLLPLLASRPAPDPVTMAHWLSPSGPPGERTMHEGVHRLMQGHALIVDEAGPTTRRYWMPRYERPAPMTVEDAAAGLRPRLDRAVARRTSSSGTTGVLLSGGLDSSTVAAVASTLDVERRPSRSYSATFPLHPTTDESELIGILCDAFDLRSTKVMVSSGSVVAGALPYIVRWALPPVSPNLFFWRPLFDRARADGVDVLLDGEGGDETFGLSAYLMSDRLRHGRFRAAAELVRRAPGGGPHIPRATVLAWLRRFGVMGGLPAPVHRAYKRVRGARRYAPPWLRDGIAEHLVDHDIETAWKAHHGPRWWRFLFDAVAAGAAPRLGHDHIRRRAAMSGLASRHPLVDVDVVEFMLRLDPELAYDPRYSRPVLRESVRGLLPDPVRLRPEKSNFNATFHEALAGPDLAVARVLLGPDAEVSAYVDLDVARAALLDSAPPHADADNWSLLLWRLLTAECWLRAEAGRGDPGVWGAALVPAVVELRS